MNHQRKAILAKLTNIIDALASPQEGTEGLRAARRQREAVEGSLATLLDLIEPWRHDGRALETVMLVLQLQLYGRILDDAVDEGNMLQRRQALAAQPLLCQSLLGLHALFPGCDAILLSAVDQASRDNDPNRGDLSRWGAKNRMILLAPELLALDQGGLGPRLAWLLDCLWLLQAAEELSETNNAIPSAELSRELVLVVQRLTQAPLAHHGWAALAAKLRPRIEDLLRTMEKYYDA